MSWRSSGENACEEPGGKLTSDSEEGEDEEPKYQGDPRWKFIYLFSRIAEKWENKLSNLSDDSAVKRCFEALVKFRPPVRFRMNSD